MAVRKTINIEDVAAKILRNYIDPEKGLISAQVEWSKISTGVVECIRKHGRDGHERKDSENMNARGGGQLQAPMATREVRPQARCFLAPTRRCRREAH